MSARLRAFLGVLAVVTVVYWASIIYYWRTVAFVTMVLVAAASHGLMKVLTASQTEMASGYALTEVRAITRIEMDCN